MSKYLHNIFFHHNLSPLVQNLYDPNQIKSDELVQHINNGLIELRNAIIRNEISENKNPNKILDTVEKIIDFNKQQKGKLLPLDF